MKRVERIIISLLIVHGLLLVISQYLILHTDLIWSWQPVHEYLGVFQHSEQANPMDF